MPPVEDYPMNVQTIELRLIQLKKRQHRVMLWSRMAMAIFLIAVVTSFVQQVLVYRFFDLSQQVEQLHIPVVLGDQLLKYLSADYFSSLLSWLGWFILKLAVAFIGAFFFTKALKKFRIFRKRFRSLILHFVGWLIGFMVIWSGMTYVQSNAKNDNKVYAELVTYDNTIQHSQMAQYLKDSTAPDAVKDYLLAQTALLHRPVDKAAALAYTADLIRAERQDPHFVEYGLKSEQLWAIQQQVYGKVVTPMAQRVQKQAAQAQQWSELVKLGCWGLSIMAVVMAILMYILAITLNNRAARIEQQS